MKDCKTALLLMAMPVFELPTTTQTRISIYHALNTWRLQCGKLNSLHKLQQIEEQFKLINYH